MYGVRFRVRVGRFAVELVFRSNARAFSNGGVTDGVGNGGGVVVGEDGIIAFDSWVAVRLSVGLSDSSFLAMQFGFQQQKSLPFPLEYAHTIPWIFSSQYVHRVDNE